MPITLLTENPLVFLTVLISLVIGISFHEFAHVFAAYLQGDETGKRLGRLTLNPLAHIDPLGLVLIVFVGIGWGKPAPFDPTMLRNRRYGPALVAIAGPLSNIALVLVFGLFLRVVQSFLDLPVSNLLVIFLVNLIYYNILLVAFNLIPIPPLDGSRVLLSVLPARFEGFKQSLERYGPFVLIAVLLFGQGIFQYLFGWVNVFADRIIG